MLPAVAAVILLVFLDRDDRLDPALAQVSAVGGRGIGLIAQRGGGPGAGTARAPAADGQLQNELGFSALRAGLGQTPAAVTFVVVARWAAALLPRTGVRPLVLAGCGGFLVGFS